MQQFKHLDPAEETEFREAARYLLATALYSGAVAGVSNGHIDIDVELWHPVFLDELGKALQEHAASRMDRVKTEPEAA